jgi:hypothetical protein
VFVKWKIPFRLFLVGSIGAIAIGTTGAASAAPPGVTLTLSSASGPVGSNITISGKIFPKTSSVSLMWDGSISGIPPLTASPSGSFSVSLAVPSNATVGSHTIAANANGATAQSGFQVTGTTPALTPTAAPTSTQTAVATSTPTARPTNTATPSTITSPPIGNLSDGLTQGSLNSSLWSVGQVGGGQNSAVTVTDTTSGLQIRPLANAGSINAYNGVFSTATYNLTNGAAFVHAAQTAVGAYADTSLDVTLNASNTLDVVSENGSLYFQKTVGGTTTNIAAQPYSPTSHAWWRIREASGSVYWETAPDGSAWTTQAQAADPFAVVSMQVALNAGTYQSVANPGQAVFQNLNVAPTTATATPITATATPTAAPATPTATPQASGTLLFSADFESGNLSQWAGGARAGGSWGNSSVTVVKQGDKVAGLNSDGPWTAPVSRKGTYSGALLVDGPTVGHSQRAEVGSGVAESPGNDRYYGLTTYLPSNPNQSAPVGPLSIANYALWQFGAGTSIDLEQGQGQLGTGQGQKYQLVNVADGTYRWYDLGAVTYDAWVDWTIHVKWATDTSGVVEVWRNGTKMMTVSGVRTYGNVQYNQSEYDWYRADVSYANLMYLDQVKIGTTYSIVQP